MQAVFHDALALPHAERRSAIERAAGDDTGLAAEVLAMLDQDARGESLLHRPVGEVAGGVLPGLPRSAPPEQLGPYRVLDLLGEGGMGVVYLAERTDLGNRVAIKFLRDAWLSPARRGLFDRERRSLARLNHPNIARLYDADALADGTPWFAMEYVDGLPVTDWCRTQRKSVRERVQLFTQVCDAVAHAHGQALLHRDLKPSNIFVTTDGRPKLLDFGIAKPLDDPGTASEHTGTAFRAFTPSYAAPEQFRGDPVGVHTDVYALGAVLYELLSGRPPLDLAGLGPAAAERRVTEEEPAPVSVAVRQAAEGSDDARRMFADASLEWTDLDVLCAKALQKDPARRYRSVDALQRDLQHALRDEPLDARPDSARYRAAKFVRRHRASVVAATLATILLVSVVSYSTVHLARARDAALAEAARTRRIQSFVHSLFEGGDTGAGPSDTLRAVSLLERGVQEAAALEREPLVQAELFHTLGGIFDGLGRLERADDLHHRALAIRERALGNRSAEVARSLEAIARLRVHQSRYAEAESLARLALTVTAAPSGATPQDHARVLATLGTTLEHRGDYEQAIAQLREATRLDSLAGTPPGEASVTLTELANSHFYAGHYAVADSINRQVLELDRRLYGDRHPRVAGDLVNLGAMRQEVGEWPAAESYYRQALEIYRGWYGEQHFETAATLNMVGRALVQQDRFEEGGAMIAKALAIREAIYGPTHASVASTLNEIGQLAHRQGQWDRALAAYDRMLAIVEEIYGGRHYLIGLALANQASVHAARGAHREAEVVFRRALVRYRQAVPEDHPYVAVTRIKLGREILRQGRAAEAIPETRAGYAILAAQDEPMLGFLQAARRDLAQASDAIGRSADAAKYRAEAERASADSARAAGNP